MAATTANIFEHLRWDEEVRNQYLQAKAYAEKFGKANLEPWERRLISAFDKATARVHEIARSTKIGKRGGDVSGKLHFEWKREELKAYSLYSKVEAGYVGAWNIVKEEELFAINALKPVLNQLDTTKRHLLNDTEWLLVKKAAARTSNNAEFDRAAFVDHMKAVYKEHWNQSRWDNWLEKLGSDAYLFPVFNSIEAADFRAMCRRCLLAKVREIFPSLGDLPVVGTKEWDDYIAEYF